MSRRAWLGICGSAACALGSAGAQDDDPVIDRTPRDCLSTNRIDRTKVVDDQTVLFYLRGGDVYQTILPRDCPGLERNDRFMYSSFGGRLCDTDTITVLENFGGRFDRGFTCRLGSFHQISEAEADDLVRGPADVGVESTIGVEPAELPDSDAEDEADSEEAGAQSDVDDTDSSD